MGFDGPYDEFDGPHDEYDEPRDEFDDLDEEDFESHHEDGYFHDENDVGDEFDDEMTADVEMVDFTRGMMEAQTEASNTRPGTPTRRKKGLAKRHKNRIQKGVAANMKRVKRMKAKRKQRAEK